MYLDVLQFLTILSMAVSSSPGIINIFPSLRIPLQSLLRVTSTREPFGTFPFLKPICQVASRDSLKRQTIYFCVSAENSNTAHRVGNENLLYPQQWRGNLTVYERQSKGQVS